MQRRFRRTCPLCGRPDLKNISTHLLQVHGLQSKERKPYLKQAKMSSWQPYIDKSPYMNSEKQGEKRVSRRAYSLPTKKPKTAQASLTTKPFPEFNFRHKFSLLVVGPSQSGKTYFVQQILENNRIVYDEIKRIRIFWYYNQWQDCYDSLRKSLGKSIQFERGLPELSENMSEIHTRYNNIIILDDLMAEAIDSPVVSRLFTQGRHRNASVILLLQNMFPKGKFNTDISRNAQYLALFRSPSDRKQIGVVGERMFDKNRVHFMNAYYKQTEKPFGYLVVDNKPDTPADKQVLGDLFDDLAAMFTSSPPKLKRTILMSSQHRVTSLEENNINIIRILPGRMQLFLSGKTTVWERRWSVTFPKDMLSQRCISHRAIVLILAIRVSTSTEKIIGLLK